MPPATLFRYLTGRMAFVVVAIFAGLAALVFVADIMENLRFAGKYADGSFLFALAITAYRTPGLLQLVTPFVFLFAGFWVFGQLNRRSELSVMRSAGMSIWRLIAPAALFAFLFGLASILLIDPAATRATALSERMKDDIRGRTSSLVRVFGDGMWLRQRDADATLLINADAVSADGDGLQRVTVWRLDSESRFLERIDAREARFADRRLELVNASMKAAGEKLAQKTPLYGIPTTLRAADFREGAPRPETMSVWDLPRYSRVAEAAGLPTVRYDIRFHDLCSTPLKLMAMVMVAAVFSLRPARSGGTFMLVVGGVAAGFAFYFMTEIAAALGESGAAPPVIAAWSPALLGLLLATIALLQIEDG